MRIKPRIAQPIVDGADAGGAGIREPGDLDRRRFAGERQRPAVRHVHGQIDEDIDIVRANDFSERRIIVRANVAPYVGEALDPPRVFIGALHTRVAEHFECSVIVMREQRHSEQTLTVIAKIRRDVADLEAAGRNIGPPRRIERPHGHAEARVPAQALIENGARFQGLEIQGVGEIAVCGRILRIEFECLAKASYCLI